MPGTVISSREIISFTVDLPATRRYSRNLMALPEALCLARAGILNDAGISNQRSSSSKGESAGEDADERRRRTAKRRRRNSRRSRGGETGAVRASLNRIGHGE